MKTNYNKAIDTAKKIAVTGLAALTIGCAGPRANISPHFSTRTDNSGELRTEIGIKYGADNSRKSEGLTMGAVNTLTGPFQIYSFKEDRWFPEFKDHLWRTSGMTAVYIAGAAIGMSGGSSRSSGNSEPAQDYVAPATPTTSSNNSSSDRDSDSNDDSDDSGDSGSDDDGSHDGGI